MNIAFVTTEYPHQRVGRAAGIGTSIQNLAKELVKLGHQVSIIVPYHLESAIFDDEGIRIHLIQSKQYRFGAFYRNRKNLQRYINTYSQIEKWDVIEMPDWTGFAAFMKLRIPLVVRLHGSDTYFCHLEKRSIKKRNFLLEKNGVHRADAIISPSAFTADLTASLFKLDRSKIAVIPSGIAIDRFRNVAPDVFEDGLILCYGTIIRKKGALELPQIFSMVAAHYPKAKLLLLGGDAADITTGSESTCELLRAALPADLLEKVSYPGRVPYDEVQKYIRQAHVCIFPTFAETQGMVTIEAMAMQKAVVNSNIGWANEIITEGVDGLMAHPADHRHFADQILRILQDDSLRRNLAQNAVQRVRERFDIARTVHDNLDLYRKVSQR